MQRALRFRDFRLLFAGETVSVLGDHFHFVALAWLTLQLTGSGLALGSVLMTAAIPRAVFMLVGGALSDRWSPRNLMLYSNAIRAAIVGVVAGLVLTDRIELWHLYLMAAAFGVVDALFYPAINTILPMIVDDPSLPPANAAIQGSQQLAGLIGPALAGVVVALVETGPAFAFDAISFAVAAVAIAFIAGGRRVPAGVPAESGNPNLLETIRDGFRYAWGDPAVRSLIVLTAAFNFAFTGTISVGLPFLADHVLGGGSATFGLLLSAFGGGSLAGALAAGTMARPSRLGAVVLGIGVSLGVGLGLVGVAPNVPVALATLALMGLGVGFINVHVVSWLQVRTADEMRGRVMSLVMLGSMGLAPISLALAGIVVDLGAVSVMFGVAGAVLVGASLLGFAWGVAGRMTYAPSTADAA